MTDDKRPAPNSATPTTPRDAKRFKLDPHESVTPLPLWKWQGPRQHNLTGLKKGKLTVLGPLAHPSRYRGPGFQPAPELAMGARWVVRCSCGVYGRRRTRSFKKAGWDSCSRCKSNDPKGGKLKATAALALLLTACEPSIECDEDGRCWATLPSWPAAAQYADADELAAHVPDLLTPDGECYAIVGTDAHVCVVVVECVDLLARPIAEVALTGMNCADPGPWTAASFDADGECWGVVGEFAVALMP